MAQLRRFASAEDCQLSEITKIHRLALLCIVDLPWGIPDGKRLVGKSRILGGSPKRACCIVWCITTGSSLNTPGAVMALHTAGGLLEWHPHAHAVALNGALLDDGSFVELAYVDEELIQEFFSEKVFDFLLGAGLIGQDTVSSMRSWEHSGKAVPSYSSRI